MIKLGDNNVTLKLGDNDVSKVYLGENQIYPSAPATNLVMQRISDTEYLVTGDSGTADLTFTRESDSFVDAKGVQSLPYTFTHTAGEKWSVNGVNAWGIDIPLGGALEAENFTDLDFNNYMYLRLKLAAGAIQTDNSPMYFGKIAWGTVEYWGVYSRGGHPTFGNITFFSVNGVVSQVNNTQFSMQPPADEWSEISTSLGVNEITLEVNGNTETLAISNNNRIPFQTTLHKFRIGNTYPSASTVKSRFQGVVNYYKHGTEEFLMQEGSGTTTVGSEGTILNLVAGASWVTI